MTNELQTMQLNVQVANKLVNQLSLLDGQGYSIMGTYSRKFLSDVATTGQLDPGNLAEYFDDFQTIYQSVTWINVVAEAKTKNWLELFADYLSTIYFDDESSEKAQELINF